MQPYDAFFDKPISLPGGPWKPFIFALIAIAAIIIVRSLFT